MADKARGKTLIIGCGTGRCGTVSLTKFLNHQAGISVLHEGVATGGVHHIIPWYNGEKQLWHWLGKLRQLTSDAKWYGDVGSYFLPYIPQIFRLYPFARVICLERNKKAVIRSFLEKTSGRNHWYPHKGIGWEEDPEWDIAFPSYAEPSKTKALGLYWDYYHAMALEYCVLFQHNFLLMPTGELNSRAGRMKLLAFVGYDNQASLKGEFRANKNRYRTVSKGLRRLAEHLKPSAPS